MKLGEGGYQTLKNRWVTNNGGGGVLINEGVDPSINYSYIYKYIYIYICVCVCVCVYGFIKVWVTEKMQ